MSIVVASSFSMNAALPIDDRIVVADSTARDSINSGRRYEGLTVYSVADAKNYQLQGGILNANWVQLAANATYYLHSNATGLTAHAGGGQGSALQLAAEFNRVTTVATAGDSVKLPAGVAGMQILVQNDGANSMNVFPASGESIDALSVNTAIAVKATKNTIFNCVATGLWKSVSGGAGGGVAVVADITARNAIDSADRYDGYLAYVLSEKNIYQLQGGILNANYVLLDNGLAVSAVQSLGASAVITLAVAMRQRVKVKASSGVSTVTLPNGTIDGQEVTVQGDDNDLTVSIANGGNIIQNGDPYTFTKNFNVRYMWDSTQTAWIAQGGM